MTTHTMTDSSGALLESVHGLAELRGLDPQDLPALAEQIRAFLIEKVCRTGGHLGSNLGVVELTIALHRVFDSPHDRILFDTGHQAYVHKILTGRRKDFDSLRQAGGLSGYPCRAESEHDVIENSHASTALSYADGLAKAFALRGEHDRRVVAVVGDGALTGGMCWEALNNIGAAPQRPIVVVLNDNGRSYAPTVGAVANHLTELRHASGDRLGAFLHNSPFEALGLAYVGPVDGHDVVAVERALEYAVALRRPVVVHCVTRKGKGYPPAEADDADCLHGVGVVDPATGRPLASSGPIWTQVFAEEMAAIGAERPDVVCLTAAMLRPVGLHPFALAFPERVFDVGLAEQHAVASAAGLALGGLRPVVALYATFLNRAFDQLLMDVALHRLPVTFVLDRAGVTGEDGSSHHGMWDLSILPVVPGLRIAEPRDSTRLRRLLREALAVTDGPTVLRFPKAAAGPDIPRIDHVGGVDVLYRSEDPDVLLVAAGALAAGCLQAAADLTARGVGATVVDPRWTAPVNPALTELVAAHRLTVSVEDNTATGGLGARLRQALGHAGVTGRLCSLALPAQFLAHGRRADILREHGLDGPGIATTVLAQLAALPFRTPAAGRQALGCSGNESAS
ncbi:MAG: 1-deoxy-D-xylulose-5-phosphate synthase [Egibacteraceae bacterium]